MAGERIRELYRHGQSVWLDFLSREMIEDGSLAGLIGGGEVTGVTANPTTFNKAIGEGNAYDSAIRDYLHAHPDAEAKEVYEALAVSDVRDAADMLRAVFDRTGGDDGYVSLEVSPHIAYDTAATVAEARRLCALVDRPNAYIKVPSTAEGFHAVTRLISEGININVTLMFSLRDYVDAADAYMAGLEMRSSRGMEIKGVSSVASFFVSRIDAAVDRRLPADSQLRGKVAVANTRVAYAIFNDTFASECFAPLKARGGRIQKFLVASTGVKDPAYRDTMYAEELIGPFSIDTMPLATLEAFRDHGEVCGDTLLERPSEAERLLGAVREAGIDLNEVCGNLKADGVNSFARSFDALMATLERKKELMSASV